MSGTYYVPVLEAVLHRSHLNFRASPLFSSYSHSIDSIGRKRGQKAVKQAGQGDLKEGVIPLPQMGERSLQRSKNLPKVAKLASGRDGIYLQTF